MIELATIFIRDIDTQSDAVAVLRMNGKNTHLCLSVAADGDVEVVMDKATARELLQALSMAVNDPLG